MIKVVNGEYIEMTAEEEAKEREIIAQCDAIENSRPMTSNEVIELVLKKQINNIDVDDNLSLRMKDYYPTFEELEGESVPSGFKFVYNGELYKTRQDSYTMVPHYKPGNGTESLFEKIDETHTGTIDDPIPYGGNMELFNGKYYSQNGVVYLCNRDSNAPLYHDLSNLVGLYVQVV